MLLWKMLTHVFLLIGPISVVLNLNSEMLLQCQLFYLSLDNHMVNCLYCSQKCVPFHVCDWPMQHFKKHGFWHRAVSLTWPNLNKWAGCVIWSRFKPVWMQPYGFVHGCCDVNIVTCQTMQARIPPHYKHICWRSKPDICLVDWIPHLLACSCSVVARWCFNSFILFGGQANELSARCHHGL